MRVNSPWAKTFWLAAKTDGPIAQRARTAALIASVATIAFFAIGGIATGMIDGYRIESAGVIDGASNPLAKHVVRETGAWFTNYSAMPWTLLAPTFGFMGAALAFALVWIKRPGWAFIFSSLSILGIVSTAGVSMAPFILPSSLNPDHSLTMWDASSSANTLWMMLLAAVVLLPIILTYTAWVYRVLWGKVTAADITHNDASY